MPIATGLAIGLGVAAAAGSVGSAAIGANAAGNAAGAQVSAEEQRIAEQRREADNALALQKSQFDKKQQNIAPWLEVQRNIQSPPLIHSWS